MKSVEMFNKIASPVIVLAASVAMVATATDAWSRVAGIGLTVAAGASVVSTIAEKSWGRATTALALGANAILTANGFVMFGNGLANGDVEQASAGLTLGLANGVLFGGANLSTLQNNMTQNAHANICLVGGFMIAAAGVVMRDPVLTFISSAFITDALLRDAATDPKPHETYPAP